MSRSAVIVCGVSLLDAVVSIEDVPSGQAVKVTQQNYINGSWIIEFVISDLTYSALHIRSSSYADYDVSLVLLPGNQQIWINYNPGPSNIPHLILPDLTPKTLSKLRVDGMNIVDENNEVYNWCHCDGFRDYERLLNGQDINPILQQSQDLKFNGRRVLLSFDFGSPQLQRLYPFEHPDFYDRIPELLDLYAKYNLYGQLCIFADTARSVPQDQVGHFNRCVEQIRKRTNGIIELVNENDSHENYVDINSFTQPTDILSSSGSNGAGSDPPVPYWAYCNLHSERRGDYALSSTTVYYTINGYEGFPGVHRPTVNSEPPGCGINDPRRYTDPKIGYYLGLGTRWGNGGTFHCDNGLQSLLLNDVEVACAKEFVRGVRGE